MQLPVRLGKKMLCYSLPSIHPYIYMHMHLFEQWKRFDSLFDSNTRVLDSCHIILKIRRTKFQKTMDRFGFVKEIGRGAYGTVWKAIDRKTNKEVAIKRINRKFFQCHESLNIAEVRCLQQLVHPNIVTLYNAIMENNTLYLVFEWMERDLSHIIRDKGFWFLVEEVRNISFQLFKVLTRMHKEGYCHIVVILNYNFQFST